MLPESSWSVREAPFPGLLPPPTHTFLSADVVSLPPTPSSGFSNAPYGIFPFSYHTFSHHTFSSFNVSLLVSMSDFQPQVFIDGLHPPDPHLGGEITRDGSLASATGYVEAAAVASGQLSSLLGQNLEFCDPSQALHHYHLRQVFPRCVFPFSSLPVFSVYQPRGSWFSGHCHKIDLSK